MNCIESLIKWKVTTRLDCPNLPLQHREITNCELFRSLSLFLCSSIPQWMDFSLIAGAGDLKVFKMHRIVVREGGRGKKRAEEAVQNVPEMWENGVMGTGLGPGVFVLLVPCVYTRFVACMIIRDRACVVWLRVFVVSSFRVHLQLHCRHPE